MKKFIFKRRVLAKMCRLIEILAVSTLLLYFGCSFTSMCKTNGDLGLNASAFPTCDVCEFEDLCTCRYEEIWREADEYFMIPPLSTNTTTGQPLHPACYLDPSIMAGMEKELDLWLESQLSPPWEQSTTMEQIPIPPLWDQSTTTEQIPIPSLWDQSTTMEQIPIPSLWEPSTTMEQISIPPLWQPSTSSV